MSGYLFIILSSLCAILLVHLLRLAESRKLRTIPTLTANYLVATVFVMLAGKQPVVDIADELSWGMALFLVTIGAFFIGNFYAYSKSVLYNGMGISIAAMRLSLLVPVLVSVVAYGEQLTGLKIIALVAVFASLYLLIPQKKNVFSGRWDAAWLLLVIFVLTGVADTSLKIYQEEISLQLEELSFMGLIFFCAFLIGLAGCGSQKGPLITKQEFILGSLIGLPNLYSAVFLIYALGEIDGAVAYPLVNILNVTGGTFLGLWWWKDRVKRLQWIGLILALTAILMLV